MHHRGGNLPPGDEKIDYNVQHRQIFCRDDRPRSSADGGGRPYECTLQCVVAVRRSLTGEEEALSHQNENIAATPRVIISTITPEVSIPREMVGMARRRRIFNSAAAREPPQAPEPGRGVDTRR